MDIYFPDYYNKFRCLAGSCPDTCCAKWQIVIDDRTLARYGKVEEPFRTRLKNSIDHKEKVYHQINDRCAFLNEEGLCDIHGDIGPEYLCRTCRVYPRHIEEFENVREKSLALSCPEVARLLLSHNGKVTYLHKENDKSETYEEFDNLLYGILCDIRSLMVDIIQKRELDISTRFAMVLSLAHDVSRRLVDNNLFDIENVAEKYRNISIGKFEAEMKRRIRGRKPPYMGGGSRSRRQREKYYNGMNTETAIRLLESLDYFEVLNDYWPDMIEDCIEELEDNGASARTDINTMEGIRNERENERFDIMMEQIAIYFIYIYYVGGVYDGRTLNKLKAAIYSTLIIAIFIKTKWLESRRLVLNRCVEYAYKYSREIEHSDENLELIEELMKKYSTMDMVAFVYEILGR